VPRGEDDAGEEEELLQLKFPVSTQRRKRGSPVSTADEIAGSRPRWRGRGVVTLPPPPPAWAAGFSPGSILQKIVDDAV